MSEPRGIRILIVDDHPIVREGLAALIHRRPDMSVVASAANGKEAVELYQRHHPDVVLMDLRMPEMDGVAATAAIRERSPRARIVLLTTYDTDTEITRGVRAGAMAYMLKDAPREQLLETIRAVHAGQRRIPPDIAAKLAEHVGTPEPTPREIEILELILGGKSNREIADELFVTEGTVKAHINRILDKLGVEDRTQAVVAALKRGIIRLD